ncbi:UNVERIFIED_CONTAM: hypothetical protein FKN15_041935 [Acipenser sinensis]
MLVFLSCAVQTRGEKLAWALLSWVCDGAERKGAEPMTAGLDYAGDGPRWNEHVRSDRVEDYADTEMLLSRENVDQEALLNYACEAADFSTNHQLPKLDFAINHYGQTQNMT